MTQESLFLSHDKAVGDINRMLDVVDRPKISKQQEYWQNRANKLAILTKKPMVVVMIDKDNWQVWNQSVADKCGADYVYVTGGSE